MGSLDYNRIKEVNLKKLYNDKNVSAKNKQDFKKYIQALEVSPARLGLISNHIRYWFYELDDVVGCMDSRDKINEAKQNIMDKVSFGYFETIKKVGKAFVRWHNYRETPKGWVDVKSNSKAQKRDLYPDDMVLWEEGLAMSKNTSSVQLKAVLLTQLDGGFRPSEFINLNYGDVQIKDNFAIITVHKGKTGKRNVILFRSVPHLQRWLNAHPFKNDNSPLWIKENQKKKKEDQSKEKESQKKKKEDQNNQKEIRYEYAALRKRIRELGEKTGVNKPLDFYNLRHSAAFLSKMDNVNPELAARKFGHSVRYYTETYGRLSPEDDIKRYSKHYDVQKEKKAEEERTRVCPKPKCGVVNEPNAEKCENCGTPISEKAVLDTQQEMERMKEQMAELVAEVASVKEIKEELKSRKE